LFARKLIRLHAGFPKEDLDNEVETLVTLSQPELTDTVVEALKHDWLQLDSIDEWYYIDMEYCPRSLEDYINGVQQQDEDPPGPASPPYGEQGQRLGTSVETPMDRTVHDPEEMEFDWEPVVEIVFDIASGLVYLHDQSIVHRDLKPSKGSPTRVNNTNTLVLFSSKSNRWKLSDFGTATQATSSTKHTTSRRGTDSYRAPEILLHKRFSKKSDIFALGCILYEIILRRKLFSYDFEIEQYGRSGESVFPDKWPESPPDSVLYKLGELAASLLEIDPHKRLSARDTCIQLRTIAKNGGVALGEISNVASEEEPDISEAEIIDSGAPLKVHPANMAPARAASQRRSGGRPPAPQPSSPIIDPPQPMPLEPLAWPSAQGPPQRNLATAGPKSTTP
jgi:serine/threonine protein kinase